MVARLGTKKCGQSKTLAMLLGIKNLTFCPKNKIINFSYNFPPFKLTPFKSGVSFFLKKEYTIDSYFKLLTTETKVLRIKHERRDQKKRKTTEEQR